MSIEVYNKERQSFFDNAFNKEFGRIEDYRFRGYNSALGCFVESKAHYKRILQSRGLVPADAAEEMAEEVRSNADRVKNKPLSEEAQAIIKAIRACPRKKDGTIELGGRLIEAMVRIKAIGNDSPYDPMYAQEGGWS
jgi:hypothetical protein